MATALPLNAALTVAAIMAGMALLLPLPATDCLLFFMCLGVWNLSKLVSSI